MPIDFNQNYFELFGLEQSVNVNYKDLEKKYLEYQKKFHPDKYINGSDNQKMVSLQIISFINEAYKILKDDYLKSIYLLKTAGYEIDNQSNITISDREFLIHQVELREELEEITSKKNREKFSLFINKISEYKKKCIKDFELNFSNNAFDQALNSIKKLKFYLSIENDLKRNR